MQQCMFWSYSMWMMCTCVRFDLPTNFATSTSFVRWYSSATSKIKRIYLCVKIKHSTLGLTIRMHSAVTDGHQLSMSSKICKQQTGKVGRADREIFLEVCWFPGISLVRSILLCKRNVIAWVLKGMGILQLNKIY